MYSISALSRYALAVLLLWTQSLVFATPTYHFLPGSFGDEAAPVDFNDLGAIVWQGFANGPVFCGGPGQGVGGSYIQSSSGGGFDGFVRGYDGITTCGVHVSDINNAGDMLGTAIHNGIEVPTLWIGGVAFDLTSPANSGLYFAYDPGPKWGQVQVPVEHILSLPGHLDGSANGSFVAPGLINAHGDLVFAYSFIGPGVIAPGAPFGGLDVSYGILKHSVPEPGTLALLAVAAIAAPFRSRKT